MHIQDEHGAKSLEPHWGYSSRVIPCVNDNGTCEYLSVVYHSHDVSMLYTFILWAVLGVTLVIWLAVRVLAPRFGILTMIYGEAGQAEQKAGILHRFSRATIASRRRWLLPEGIPSIFGHASRLQITILAVLLGYLLIFSLIGVVYKTWVTPIKNSTLRNTRSGIGPWGDRVGALAYALTPFTVALSTRESILSLITGLPYQHFGFLHRWTGRIIYVQSVLHTLAWTIVEGHFYLPQPEVYKSFIEQQYMVFGCVALLFISFIFFFSLSPVIRLTGYEFFRKSHYIVALLYIGACWGHWSKLACWMIASLGLFFLDRFIRIIRTLLIHFGRKDPSKGVGFRSAGTNITMFPDIDATVLALDFAFPHSAWENGQHFFLTFPELTIWQAHPMTPASLPAKDGLQRHRYIIRARNGETGRLARLAARKTSENGGAEIITMVILNGPYGCGVMPSSLSTHPTNILAVAGGTGISFALPIVMEAVKAAEETGVGGAIQLVWIIRKTRNLEWIAEELAVLREKLTEKRVDLGIKIFVTKDTASSTSSLASSSHDVSMEEKEYGDANGVQFNAMAQSPSVSALTSKMDGFSIEWLDYHPHLDSSDGSGIIEQWLAHGTACGGTNHVYGSGPASMGADLRVAIAAKNDGVKVFKGDGSSDVEFYWDDRFA